MIRRSPAEFYIRYRILKTPGKTDKEILKELAGELVFAPTEAYIKDLREQMKPPPGFEPGMLGHAQSQFFLRAHGIWSMFFPSRSTHEAMKIFDDPRTRSLLQTLICGTSGIDEIIRDAFLRKSTLPLSEGGLEEFKHYFWNIDLLTTPELVEYIHSFLKDYRMSNAAKMPVNPSTIQSTLHSVGVEPNYIDVDREIEAYKATFVALRPVYQELLAPGHLQAMALRHNMESFVTIMKVQKEVARESGETLEEARKFAAITHDTEIIDLNDLGRGKVPMPVALLRRPDDKEETEEEKSK